jgi:glutamate-1-semialdehyde 2,1-aminomutase
VDIIGLNDFAALEDVFQRHDHQLACVVLEPIIGNAGSIAASQAWLQRLRDLCTSHGTLLIIDEVKSGFRVAKGGVASLVWHLCRSNNLCQSHGQWLSGGGFGGRADVMDVVGAHAGAVVHGGTYTANLVGLSAAHCTLNISTHTDALQTVNRVGERVRDLLGRVFTPAGIEHTVRWPPIHAGHPFHAHGAADLPRLAQNQQQFIPCVLLAVDRPRRDAGARLA